MKIELSLGPAPCRWAFHYHVNMNFMTKPFDNVASFAATALADCERKIEAQASSIQRDGGQRNVESESTIEFTLIEGEDETMARIAFSRTRD